MQNTSRNFILQMDFSAGKKLEVEIDFSEHRSCQLEWVEIDISMAVSGIAVERVNAPEVITATLMIDRCPKPSDRRAYTWSKSRCL
jgi:hypothetical protein